MHWRIERELLEKKGILISLEEQVSFTGKSERDWLQQVKEKHNASFSIDEFIETMTARKLAAATEVTLMPGVEELLNELKDEGFKMAVATGASRIFFEEVRKSLDLDRWFTRFITADNVTKGKPAPDIFLTSAEQLGVQPADCLVFEDGTVGLEAAAAAKMYAVAFRNNVGPASLRIETFDEIDVARLRSL